MSDQEDTHQKIWKYSRYQAKEAFCIGMCLCHLVFCPSRLFTWHRDIKRTFLLVRGNSYYCHFSHYLAKKYDCEDIDSLNLFLKMLQALGSKTIKWLAYNKNPSTWKFYPEKEEERDAKKVYCWYSCGNHSNALRSGYTNSW